MSSGRISSPRQESRGVGRDRVSEAQVATAKAAVAAAEQQLAVSQANQNKTKTLFATRGSRRRLRRHHAPRYADTGAMIQAGTSSQSQAMPSCGWSQNSLLRLILQVPEFRVARIHVGQPVEVKVQPSTGRCKADRAIRRTPPISIRARWRPK